MNTTSTSATLAPADELRTAVQRLRCDHSFPVLPPAGSLANPGPCMHCGVAYAASSPVADHLREPLAKLLEQIGGDMHMSAAEEQAFPDHVAEYQQMVVDDIGDGRFDWTHAHRLARTINGGAA